MMEWREETLQEKVDRLIAEKGAMAEKLRKVEVHNRTMIKAMNIALDPEQNEKVKKIFCREMGIKYTGEQPVDSRKTVETELVEEEHDDDFSPRKLEARMKVKMNKFMNNLTTGSKNDRKNLLKVVENLWKEKIFDTVRWKGTSRYYEKEIEKTEEAFLTVREHNKEIVRTLEEKNQQLIEVEKKWQKKTGAMVTAIKAACLHRKQQKRYDITLLRELEEIEEEDAIEREEAEMERGSRKRRRTYSEESKV